MHGDGLLKNSKGEVRFQGLFQNDKKNGKGCSLVADGSYYDGTYKDNKKDGSGEQTWPDGRLYRG